ncbi:MAG: Transcription antitermination protein NusB [Gammaproteobacteria bacterium]|nr:Transcription antitermination protein NusB [Gammaproteobacteria bacterium]
MISAGSRHFARQAAVQALYQWDLTEQAPETILEHFIQEHDTTELDEEYFQLLVREVPLYHRELEAHIIPVLDRELEEVDPVERAILRIGTYELEYRADVPRNVVINESVELAKTFGAELSYKFINGILDRVAADLRRQTEPTG